jgi:hypothetical protein
MKKIAVVFALIIAVFLTACSSTYNINELGIDKEKHPNWSAKLRSREDFDYLDVYYYGRMKSEPMQKMTYMVFASSAEAKAYYKYWLSYCDDSSEVLDKGFDWFITRLPNTYDVVITSLFYRDGNVIICANVDVTTYSTIGDSSTTDNSDLRPYVMEKHSDIRKSVLEMLE